MLDNPGDAVSMRRILNARVVASAIVQKPTGVYSGERGCSFAGRAAGRSRRQSGDAEQPGGEGDISGFVELLDGLRGHLDEDLGELVESVLERTGYRRELESSTDPQELARLDNLNELVSVAHEFSTDLSELGCAGRVSADAPEDEDVPDTGVLARFSEARVAGRRHRRDPGERRRSGHADDLAHREGLEFPVVFVTGWEDGMFPHMRALDDPRELSEERRLAYVGITRARQRLYLSRAIVRSSWGQPMLNPESRFLREIPQELIDWRRIAPKPSFSAPGQRRRPVRYAALGARPPGRASGRCWCLEAR